MRKPARHVNDIMPNKLRKIIRNEFLYHTVAYACVPKGTCFSKQDMTGDKNRRWCYHLMMKKKLAEHVVTARIYIFSRKIRVQFKFAAGDVFS